jgi:hypothetical protein
MALEQWVLHGRIGHGRSKRYTPVPYTHYTSPTALAPSFLYPIIEGSCIPPQKALD